MTRGFVLAFGIGIGGAFLFQLVNMPLPWLLGAMLACLVATLLHVPIRRASKLEPSMRAVLGLMAGSSFSPDIVHQIPEFLTSLAFLVPYVVLSGGLGTWFLLKTSSVNFATAFFSAMPGGLSDMCAFGASFGGDERQMVLVHTTRVFVLVFTVPFIIEWMEGVNLGGNLKFGGALSDFNLPDAAMFLVCAVGGWWVALKLRISGPVIIGPLIASAIVHSLGLTDAQLPDELIKLSQLVLGVGLGCAFAGLAVGNIMAAIVRSVVLIVMLMMISMGVAYIIVSFSNISFASVLLAYVPGGQAEMTLIALTIGNDVSFIVVHHVLRLLFVVITAPIIFRLYKASVERRHKKSDRSG